MSDRDGLPPSHALRSRTAPRNYREGGRLDGLLGAVEGTEIMGESWTVQMNVLLEPTLLKRPGCHASLWPSRGSTLGST